MRILILGKNGMLGHELQKVFAKEDFIALGSKELDITDREAVFETFMSIQPDLVINATGYTNVDLAENEQEMANEVNGYAVGVLAQACREIDATFVHFSTDYVFDGEKNSYQEDSGTNPKTAYGQSKDIGEKLLIEEMEMEEFQNEPSGKYFLIRTSWLFGKHGKNFVDTIIKFAQEKPELKIVNDQHGKPTFAKDLAEQTKWLIESKEYPSGVYHIVNEGETTWYDFAVQILTLKGITTPLIPCSTAEFPRPAPRPKYSVLVNTKLPQLRNWKEALEEYLSTD